MQAAAAYPQWRVAPAPVLPVGGMILGQPAEQAAALLPRVFNLCRVAQGTAARAAFGLPPEDGWQAALRAEILREHVVKLCLKWPALLSIPALPLPRDWLTDGPATRLALFGPAMRLPESAEAFDAFLVSGQGIAPLLRAIAQAFAPFEACRAALPAASVTGFPGGTAENSVAARHADRPVMQAIEASHGRSPLWSAAALAHDVNALLDGALPEAALAPGCAIVPAARGLYRVTARVEGGIVTEFERVTPTDHLLAPGGMLAQSLATLPQERGALIPLLVAILDPCHPVAVRPAEARERVDA